VIVRNGRVVGAGYHHRAGEPHAEVLALRQAGRRAAGATLYVTLEPCSTWGRTGPCTGAVKAAGIRRVVAAVRDPNPKHRGRGIRLLRAAGIEVQVGTMAVEAGYLLRPFAKWIRTGRPFVTLKLGLTLDGRIADSLGRSKWITSVAARRWVRRFRRRVDAVVVGAGTARTDDPALLSAKRGGLGNARVVVTADGALPRRLRLFRDGAADRTVVATTPRCPASRLRRMRKTGAQVWVLPAGVAGAVGLRALLNRLGEAGFLHVLVEGGGRLAADLIREGLVDECRLIYAGVILGSDAVPGVGGKGWRLQEAPRLRIASVERLGTDVMVTAVPSQEGFACSRD
jgi:diaminohydroxyphosphoribosylaminopyrimidine deaminase/5-amino-6-(5-phosphoribosylamino)uracil reductase